MEVDGNKVAVDENKRTDIVSDLIYDAPHGEALQGHVQEPEVRLPSQDGTGLEGADRSPQRRELLRTVPFLYIPS